MGTNTGQVMTLCNSIIGVSILAMPFCFKQCGIVLSVLLLCLSSILSRFACHFLLKAAIITRRRNYEFLAFHVFGSTGKLGVELAIIGFLLGTCIAFFVVMGDLGPAIISSVMGLHRTDTLRTSILVCVAVFVVLPLGLLRNVDSLGSLCTATFAFYLCLVLKVVGEATGPMVTGDWLNEVNFWRPEGILQCSPIFSMALFCQTQLFEIFDTVPNVALDKLNSVVRVAINMCTAVYISVGFFGYVAFNKENITGNILVSLSQTMSSEVIKLGFLLSMAVSFPLVIFPCRASLYSLLYRSAQPPVHDIGTSHVPESRFKLLTFGIVGTSLVMGLVLPNIERVLGIIGSTIGVGICIITPSLLLGSTARHSRDRLISQVIMWSGAVIMILGTYAHILSAGQASNTDPGQGANHILGHAVDHPHETPQEVIGFQPLPREENVKKFLDSVEEKVKAQISENTEEKNKVSLLSLSDRKNEKSPILKTVEIDSASAKVIESAAKSKVISEIVNKPIEANEKVQADVGEKQQEPLEPVEAVVKKASAQPVVAVMPVVPVVPVLVPSKEQSDKELKAMERKMKIKEESVPEKSKPATSSNAEQVNQDAIRHEDAESALEATNEKEKNVVVDKAEQKQSEVEEQKKKEEEKKLIETLKEHQEVQRDMLNEQQRILQELKKHEQVYQQVLNEVVKDSPLKSGSVQNLSPQTLDNAPKYENEQDRKTNLLSGKTNLEKLEKPMIRKFNSSSVASKQVVIPAVVSPGGKIPLQPPKELKFERAGSVPVIPLPLAYSAKVSVAPPAAKTLSEQMDSKPAARDILESGARNQEREKRDVGTVEPDQGAGNGPVAEELTEDELKQSKDVPKIGNGYAEEECKRNEKDSKSHNLQAEDTVDSITFHNKDARKDVISQEPNVVKKTAFSNVKNDVLVDSPMKENSRTLERIDIVSQQPDLGKGQSQLAMELKTPSSISEPHFEIPVNLHEAQKLSGSKIPVHSTNNFKTVQSQERQ